MKKWIQLALFSLFLGTMGCTIASVKYSAIAADPAVGSAFREKGSERPHITYTDCTPMILFIPLGWPQNPDEFFASALKQAPGANALIDANIRVTSLFTFFYNRTCQIIEGTPVKI